MTRIRVVLTTALGGVAFGVLAADHVPVSFTVVNRGPHVVREIYACPTRSSKWGANLTAHPVKPSQSVTVQIAGGCGTYDMRFVADKGVEYMDDEVQVCGDDDVLTLRATEIKRTKRSAAH